MEKRSNENANEHKTLIKSVFILSYETDSSTDIFINFYKDGTGFAWTEIAYTNHHDGWAAQLGTTLADNIREKYKGRIKGPVPTYDSNGTVYNSLGDPFYIVHQYVDVTVVVHKVLRSYTPVANVRAEQYSSFFMSYHGTQVFSPERF